ncbi:MAG: DUF5615 family PIN-like protein [Bdellovibrio bacteriovorus]
MLAVERDLRHGNTAVGDKSSGGSSANPRGVDATYVDRIRDGSVTRNAALAALAAANGMVLIPKDRDVRDSHRLAGTPSPLVRLTLSNLSNTAFLTLFDEHWDELARVLAHGPGYVEVGRGGLIVFESQLERAAPGEPPVAARQPWRVLRGDRSSDGNPPSQIAAAEWGLGGSLRLPSARSASQCGRASRPAAAASPNASTGSEAAAGRSGQRRPEHAHCGLPPAPQRGAQFGPKQAVVR